MVLQVCIGLGASFVQSLGQHTATRDTNPFQRPVLNSGLLCRPDDPAQESPAQRDAAGLAPQARLSAPALVRRLRHLHLLKPARYASRPIYPSSVFPTTYAGRAPVSQGRSSRSARFRWSCSARSGPSACSTTRSSHGSSLATSSPFSLLRVSLLMSACLRLCRRGGG